MTVTDDRDTRTTPPTTPPTATPTATPTPTEAPTARQRARTDLLRYAPIAWVMRSRLYPAVPQAVVAAAFVLVGYELIAGPDVASKNAGTALMWVLWWPLIPIIFLAMGRVWCAVCPFGTLNDLVQKAVGVNKPVPEFLKKYGIWLIDAAFIAITWADHVWGVVESPWGSGVLLLLLTTAVIVSGAFFQRRAFCRYLCPIGGMSGNYARTGGLALRADATVCKTCTSRAVCFNGGDKAPECPLWQFPRTMDSNANCNLCARCVKNCPNDAISITVRKPTSELWFIRKPKVEESFLAVAIMGIVITQNITMLAWWNDALAWIETTTGITNYAVVFTALFAVAVTLPVAGLALAARIAKPISGETVIQGFARFGYALIPLDVAGHIAHNLFHLLAEGGAVWNTSAALLGSTSTTTTQLVATPVISALQYLIVAAGAAASVYAAIRLARSRYGSTPQARRVAVPYIVLIGVFTLMNVYLFTLPMAHRM